MKKLTIVLSALFLTLTITACSKDKATDKGGSATESSMDLKVEGGTPDTNKSTLDLKVGEGDEKEMEEMSQASIMSIKVGK